MLSNKITLSVDVAVCGLVGAFGVLVRVQYFDDHVLFHVECIFFEGKHCDSRYRNCMACFDGAICFFTDDRRFEAVVMYLIKFGNFVCISVDFQI